jgi:hypothetical protein
MKVQHYAAVMVGLLVMSGAGIRPGIIPSRGDVIPVIRG